MVKKDDVVVITTRSHGYLNLEEGTIGLVTIPNKCVKGAADILVGTYDDSSRRELFFTKDEYKKIGEL